MGNRPPFLPMIEDDGLFVARDIQKQDWVASSYVTEGVADTEFLGVSIPLQRITYFFAATVLVLGSLLMRSAYLQGAEGAELSGQAQRNQVRLQPIIAKRGVVYDRNGVVLVSNIPNFSVRVTTGDLPKDEDVREQELGRLREILGVATEIITEKLSKADRYTPVIIADQIPYDTALRLQVVLANAPGIELVAAEQRQYHIADTLSLGHILGYAGRINQEEYATRKGQYFLQDTIGKSGLELSYEEELRGQYGQKQVEVDALGREKRILAQDSARDGSYLKLELDRSLQYVSERVLMQVAEQFKIRRGVVVITNPKTGGVLSMVSLPAYDTNDFVKGISQEKYQALLDDPEKPLLNRAVNGEYPSGSTIKMIVALAGLNKGVANLETLVSSTGGITVGSWFFPDWKAGGHGMTSVTKALAESVNTYFYIVGGGYKDIKGLGALALIESFQSFGLGALTGIDLPQERVGFVPTPEWKERVKKESWYVGDTYHIAIGQGDILVTPLQVNLFTAFFANNGRSFVPRLVGSVIDPATKVETKIPPREYRANLGKSEYVQIVRQGLRKAVTDGSARRLSALPIPVAGKTGTAQWGRGKVPHAWFTGWAPFDDPQIAITVLVEEGEEGSRSAVPVAETILRWYFQPDQRDAIVKQLTQREDEVVPVPPKTTEVQDLTTDDE